ncbi:MAG: TolC family protein [Desulfuromonadales bacterium]
MFQLLIVYALLLLSAVTVEAGTVKLSLKDALNLALVNNNQIKAANFTAHAVQQGIAAANSRYLPAILFEEAFVATNSPSNAFMMKLDESRFNPADFANPDTVNHPSTRHDFKTAVSIQQALFEPSLSPLKEMAVKDAYKSELEREAVRQGVAFQVFFTYLEVQKADAHRTAADRAVADARENMRIATVRTANGVGLRSDELRSRTHLSTVEQQLITAHNNMTLARMKLALLIGLPDDTTCEISSFSEQIALPVMSDQVISDALLNRVEIRRSHTDLEKTGAALTLAKAGYLPTVGAFASYQLNGKDAPFSSDNDAWTAGISLKWNVFDGFRRNSERTRALSGESAAREMLEATTKEVTYQLRESYLRRAEADKRLEVVRHSVADAEETVRLLSKRYENSLATMVELLDAQTALNQARANLIESEAGQALAGGRVYVMTGTFVKEMLK